MEAINLIVALVGLLANLAMAGAAVVGVKMWRRQLRAGGEHETALRVLRAVYSVQSAVEDTVSICDRLAGERVNVSALATARLSLRKSLDGLGEVIVEIRALWDDNEAGLVSEYRSIANEWLDHLTLRVGRAYVARPESAEVTAATLQPADKNRGWSWVAVLDGNASDGPLFTLEMQHRVEEIERWAQPNLHASRPRRQLLSG